MKKKELIVFALFSNLPYPCMTESGFVLAKVKVKRKRWSLPHFVILRYFYGWPLDATCFFFVVPNQPNHWPKSALMLKTMMTTMMMVLVMWYVFCFFTFEKTNKKKKYSLQTHFAASHPSRWRFLSWKHANAGTPYTHFGGQGEGGGLYVYLGKVVRGFGVMMVAFDARRLP